MAKTIFKLVLTVLIIAFLSQFLFAESSFSDSKSDITFTTAERLEKLLSASVANSGGLAVKAPAVLCTDPLFCYPNIDGKEIYQWLSELTAFSEQSLHAGDIMWGRIMGSPYEYAAAQWAEQKLRQFGLEEVSLQRVALAPQWSPTAVELSIPSANTHVNTHVNTKDANKDNIVLGSAMAGYGSAATPKEGIEAPLVYVGLGTKADLMGRDLKGKIALVHGRSWSDGVIDSSSTAIQRIAEQGDALATITMLDRPGNGKVLARGGSKLPHINIGFLDGTYLRKCIERTPSNAPPVVRLTVLAEEKANLATSVVSGFIPGTTNETIILQAHLDGYWRAISDNGNGVVAVLALAKHYAALPIEQRKRNLQIVLSGGHENGSVGMSHFANTHPDIIANTVFALELEHVASMAISETISYHWQMTNVENPVGIFVVDQSPAIVQAFKDAAEMFGIHINQTHLPFYWGDIIGLMPHGVNAGGWVGGGFFFHNSLDSLNNVSPESLQRITTASAMVIDRINNLNKEQLTQGNTPFILPKQYQGTSHHYLPGPIGKLLGASRDIW